MYFLKHKLQNYLLKIQNFIDISSETGQLNGRAKPKERENVKRVDFLRIEQFENVLFFSDNQYFIILLQSDIGTGNHLCSFPVFP